MGKRKERRLAALSTAGRRVKLDLFVEPSGDLGGSSVNEEVGGDIDPMQHSGLPKSPASSGQQTQNPLLLLGQYSDDELDEESNRSPNHAAAETLPLDHNDQEGSPSEEKEVDFSAVKDLTAQKVEAQDSERDSSQVDVLQNLEGGDSGESDAAVSANKCIEVDSTKQISVTGMSNSQVVGDVNSGWRIVMHEESNQYYYWNIETGETSWEVPDVLAQATIPLSDQRVPATENLETAPVDIKESSTNLGIKLDNFSQAISNHGMTGANLIPQSQEVHGNGQQVDECVDGHRNESLRDKNCVADAYQTESRSNLDTADVLLDGAASNSEVEKGTDLSTNLMGQCECLLERLKSLKGYGGRRQCHDWMSKYILEVDIRMSDIKSLSSCGSSLLPFWDHSQRQLKRLEDLINNEIYNLAVSAQMDDDAEATTEIFKDKERAWANVGHDSDTEGSENNRKSEVACVSANVENVSHNDLHESVNAEHVYSMGMPNGHVDAGVAVGEKVNGTARPDPEFQAGEDVDMDVDMEVEDGDPASVMALGDALSTAVLPPAKHTIQPNTSPEHLRLVSGHESTVPPLPEEDWIPPPPPDSDQILPPPPDNELVPPPPPDEPPESSYPPLPSYPETNQTLPYTEHYNFSYPESSFQYYGHSVSIPSSNLYGHADASQVGVPHASIYFDVSVNTYAETAPIIVSSVEPVAYYNYQDGAVPPVPVVNVVESSCLPDDSGPVGYDALASEQIKVSDHPLEAAQDLKRDVSAVADETVKASTPITTETSATANAGENISAPSTNAAAVAAVPIATTAAKVQSKVPRSKKRTVAVAPSFRSNKKVSSLVDKWKAAKEELNENEEDEPENAYEILERKKQREIQEWHAKQIASGEAKDNANFQPLGGDWRERVKRRRAQAAKESARTASESPTPIEENQQPDLAELSKGLPSNWQAYWDEASKQVYYGNVITSETTWNKPTK